jgi:hypothetical protein
MHQIENHSKNFVLRIDIGHVMHGDDLEIQYFKDLFKQNSYKSLLGVTYWCRFGFSDG